MAQPPPSRALPFGLTPLRAVALVTAAIFGVCVVLSCLGAGLVVIARRGIVGTTPAIVAASVPPTIAPSTRPSALPTTTPLPQSAPAATTAPTIAATLATLPTPTIRATPTPIPRAIPSPTVPAALPPTVVKPQPGANIGGTYRGTVQRGYEITFRVAADGRNITAVTARVLTQCTNKSYSEDLLFFPDVTFPVQPDGSFVSEGRYPDNSIYRFNGQLRAGTATGTLQEESAGGGIRCDTKRLTWSAERQGP